MLFIFFWTSYLYQSILKCFSIRKLRIEMLLCSMGMPFVINVLHSYTMYWDVFMLDGDAVCRQWFFSASERIHNILRKFKNHNHNLLIFWFSWKFIDCSLPWMFFIFFLYRLWWALDCLPLLLMKATLDLEDGMYVTFTTRAESHNKCVTMSSYVQQQFTVTRVLIFSSIAAVVFFFFPTL